MLRVALAGILLAASGSAVVLTNVRTFGGDGVDTPVATVSDAQGNLYITGTTTSINLPVSANAFQPRFGGGTCYGFRTSRACEDIFVAKTDRRGHLIWLTYLGGSADDGVHDIALNRAGEVLVLARTASSNFPQKPAQSAFIVRLSGDGSRLLQTIGVAASAAAIAVDKTDNIWVTGSGDPTTGPEIRNALQPEFRAAGAYAGLPSTGFRPVFTNQGVYSFAFDPEGRTLYAGGTGVVMRSTDGGQSWTTGTVRPGARVAALAVDPGNTAVLYAATWEGLYRSADRGATWRGPILEGYFVAVAATRGSVYAGSRDGIYKSTDSGVTWSPTALIGRRSESFIEAIALDPLTANVVYTATEAGVMKTTDGGATWRLSTFGQPATLATWASWVTVDPVNPRVVYAGNFGTENTLVKSLDAGETWMRLAGGPPMSSGVSVAVDPVQPSRVYLSTGGRLYVSYDAGVSWRSDNNLPNRMIWRIALPPFGGTVYLALGEASGTDAYVVKLSPTGQILFSSWFGGTSTETALAIALDTEGNAFIAGTTDSPDLPVSNNALQPRYAGNNDLFLAKIAADGSRVIASTYLGGPALDDGPVSLAVDAAGSVYVAALNAGDQSYAERNGTLRKIDSALSRIVYSRSVGAPVLPASIAVDGTGRVLVGGTHDQPNPTLGQFCTSDQWTAWNGFLAMISPDGAAEQWSACIGGPEPDRVTAVTLLPMGEIAAVGWTQQPNAPPFGTQPSVYASSADVFIAVFADQPPRPVVLRANIVNGASFTTGPIAPGMILTIKGEALELKGVETSVLINGEPAPLYYVSATQINAIVPLTLNGSTARVEVRTGSLTSDPIDVPVAPFAPGIFMTAAGPAIQRAADWAIVSSANPVAPGETIVIWATGLGAVDEAGVTRTKPAVLIGGAVAVVTYSGLAPGWQGLYQVNALLPLMQFRLEPALVVDMHGIRSNPVPLFLRLESQP